jgi:hypothetical protein
MTHAFGMEDCLPPGHGGGAEDVRNGNGEMRDGDEDMKDKDGDIRDGDGGLNMEIRE